MIFTDGKFFIFYALAFALYWLIPRNELRKAWLLLCSIVFYAAWDWRFVGLVFFVIANTYAVTLLVARAEGPARRYVLIAGITVSLGVLAFFKYFDS
jgi:D-alanyl-lipoteichoic acid acyltransferase DltB (MBOAT superfamily)